MTFARNALTIAAAFTAAALLSRAILGHAPARLAADLAQPLVVVTNWGGFGAILLAVLLLALLCAALPYRNAVRSADQTSAVLVFAASALALGAAWLMPALFSSDVYAYAAYGELARLGADPYAHSTLGHATALMTAASWQWGDAIPVCVYGPGFVALAKAVALVLAPLGAAVQLNGTRALAAGAFLLCTPLAFAAYPGDRAARLRAAATIGLNPPAIWCVAEGHNDAIALAIVLAGFWLVRRGFAGAGAAVAALSGAFKIPGVAAAIALAVVDRRARAGAAIGIAAVTLLSLPLLKGVATGMAPHGRYTAQVSLQAVGPWPVGLLIAAVVAICLANAGVRRLRRGTNDGWLWLGLAAWILVPNPYPWYGLWLVALAAVAPATRVAKVAIALSFTSLLRYAPDAVAIPPPALAAALGIVAALPLSALLLKHSYDS